MKYKNWLTLLFGLISIFVFLVVLNMFIYDTTGKANDIVTIVFVALGLSLMVLVSIVFPLYVFPGTLKKEEKNEN